MLLLRFVSLLSLRVALLRVAEYPFMSASNILRRGLNVTLALDYKVAGVGIKLV